MSLHKSPCRPASGGVMAGLQCPLASGGVGKPQVASVGRPAGGWFACCALCEKLWKLPLERALFVCLPIPSCFPILSMPCGLLFANPPLGECPLSLRRFDSGKAEHLSSQLRSPSMQFVLPRWILVDWSGTTLSKIVFFQPSATKDGHLRVITPPVICCYLCRAPLQVNSLCEKSPG